MAKTFTDYALKKIKNIHGLSKRYNGTGISHSEKLLDFIRKHDHEIHELFNKKDEHFPVEVGDMMVLCMELIMDAGRDIDEITDLCYERFEKKLTGLISESRLSSLSAGGGSDPGER